ncbi:MAG: polysaccharide deacetylase family protein [Rhodothermales bacterium]|nr:polysaccharide deacetylase family protein [Rhodothermales bacterium]MCA0268969.1 polysaccharide deacetylase family protein [Bacteroidota bacterium]
MTPIFRLYANLPSRLAALLLPGVLARTGGPTPHLTFDDGPHPHTTPALLDIFAEHGQSGTFFLLADRANAYPEWVRRIADEGHTVAAHGTRHTDFWKHPRRAVAEMGEAAQRLEQAAGTAIRYIRPPYGHLTPALWRWAQQTGRTVALWDAMPGDFLPSATPERLARTMQRRARPGSLVVLHDGPAVTPEAVRLALRSGLRSDALPR